MISRNATVEPEIFVSAHSSPEASPQPRSTDPEPKAQRVRKAPKKFDPGSYVSAEHEAQSQSHVSYAYKADTTMWSESAANIEPQSYEEAINHPVYGKE